MFAAKSFLTFTVLQFLSNFLLFFVYFLRQDSNFHSNQRFQDVFGKNFWLNKFMQLGYLLSGCGIYTKRRIYCVLKKLKKE